MPTRGWSHARLSPPPKPPGLPPRQTITAAVIAALVVCSLIAGLLGSIITDAGTPVQPPIDPLDPAAAAPGAYESEMRTAIAEDPRDAAALVSLANVLTLRGALPEAIDLYERAVAADPDNADTRKAFAIALLQAGSLADAELQFRRVLERAPQDADALFFLGQLYERWSPPRLDDAARAYREAVAAQPGSPAADEAAKALARLPLGTPEPATPAS